MFPKNSLFLFEKKGYKEVFLTFEIFLKFLGVMVPATAFAGRKVIVIPPEAIEHPESQYVGLKGSSSQYAFLFIPGETGVLVRRYHTVVVLMNCINSVELRLCDLYQVQEWRFSGVFAKRPVLWSLGAS